MRRILILLLISCGLALASCSDDDGPVVDPTFGVIIEVKDTAGQPVPDLDLELTSNNPYLQDVVGAKALTVIQMTVPIETHVTVVVEDIYGDEVKTLVDGILLAGRHEVQWNANLPDGGHEPSGRYTVRMTAYDPDGDGILFEDTTDMLMCLVDPGGASIATSDQNGWIVLGDMRHFPHLFDREPMRAYDEIGEDQGELQPTAEMIVSLADSNGTTMRVIMDIPGAGFYNVTWDPSKAASPVTAGKAAGPRRDIVVPPVEWKLGPVYPNPFN